MPRANRNFLPGHIWHITQRCHKKEFLLKLRKDKRRWLAWALEAKVRFGLVILNFMITSNHIHLLAMIRAVRGRLSSISTSLAMSRALQLIESRVAQGYNARKGRRGAFWEDRFHGTAIESGPQLANCIAYIDMNMVRAGVVRHPRDWTFCGFHELGREIADPPSRRRGYLVDTGELLELTGTPDLPAHLARRMEWIEAAIRKGRLRREGIWTESVAVGGEGYLREFRDGLGLPRIGASEIVPAAPAIAPASPAITAFAPGPSNAAKTPDVQEAPGAFDGLFVLRRTRGRPTFVFGVKNDDLRP